MEQQPIREQTGGGHVSNSFRKAAVEAGEFLGPCSDAQRTCLAAPAVFTAKCPVHSFFRLLLF